MPDRGTANLNPLLVAEVSTAEKLLSFEVTILLQHPFHPLLYCSLDMKLESNLPKV